MDIYVYLLWLHYISKSRRVRSIKRTDLRVNSMVYVYNQISVYTALLPSLPPRT